MSKVDWSALGAPRTTGELQQRRFRESVTALHYIIRCRLWAASFKTFDRFAASTGFHVSRLYQLSRCHEILQVCLRDRRLHSIPAILV